MVLRRNLLSSIVALALTGLVGSPALANDFPSKPLRIIVSAPAGGSSDTLSRGLAELLSRQLGKPVVVDNKPGAGGIIGIQELLKSPRDGHTMLVTVNGVLSEIPHAMKLPLDPMREVYPLAEVARTGLVLVAAPQLPVNSLAEAIAHVKNNPGKTSYASYSAGTSAHTLGLELNKLAGLDMLHVPFPGEAPALTQVMGGQIPFSFNGPAAALPLIKTGKLKALATTSPKRMRTLPDVPTFTELGYPSLNETVWIGAFITPDVPVAVRNQLFDAVQAALQDASMKQRILASGMDLPHATRPEELYKSLQQASTKHAATLQQVGFKLE